MAGMNIVDGPDVGSVEEREEENETGEDKEESE